MAKISALTDGSAPTSADYFPSARSGANRKIQATNFPIVLAKWGVPCILASSGTMGNNGAVSGMTALPTTYSGGAWLYLPADAIQAGSAAGFYWFVASSTTAGTVYNSTFNGLSVPAAGTTTAFVSTGPGAFTGISSGEITAATVTIPAGAIGANGVLLGEFDLNHNTAAGNKIFRIDLGGTDFYAQTLTTTAFFSGDVKVKNLGAANRQLGVGSMIAVNAVVSGGPIFASLDSTGALSLTFTLEKATATNHAIWNGATVCLIYGA